MSLIGLFSKKLQRCFPFGHAPCDDFAERVFSKPCARISCPDNLTVGQGELQSSLKRIRGCFVLVKKFCPMPTFALSISQRLSLIHISEPTRQAEISYAVFCL